MSSYLGIRCVINALHFFTDNVALVDIINKATSRNATVMVFVRWLLLPYLNFNILFWARHVPGVKNILADSLFRLQVSKFKQLAPVGVQSSPTAIQLPLLLAAITSNLIQSSLQPSSIPTYHRAWTLYRKFADTVFHSASIL